MGIWYEKLLEQDHIQCKLISSKSFKPTENLKTAIPSFFISCKGLHVVIICTDEELNDNELYKLFDEKYNKITALHNNEICCDLQNKDYYVHCTKSESIMDALHIVNACMKELGRDVTGFQTIISSLEKSPDGSIIFDESIAKLITNILVPPEDIQVGFSDIRIIIRLPFQCFQAENIYLPLFIEYILKGVSSDEYFDELSKKIDELESKKEWLNEYINNIKTMYSDNGIQIENRKAGYIATDIIVNYMEKNNYESMPDFSCTHEYKKLLDVTRQQLIANHKLDLSQNTDKSNSSFKDRLADENKIANNSQNKQFSDKREER